MNTIYPTRPDVAIGRITQLTLQPTFPPQPPTNNRRTRWPVPKPVWTVSYVNRAGDTDDYILVNANECKRDSANPRAVVADGVVINVGGRVTDITK